MRRLLRFLLSRTCLILVLALAQIGVMAFFLNYYSRAGTALYTIITILSVLIVIVVFEQDNLNPAYKMMWVLLVLAMPVSGAVFYLWWGKRGITPKKARILSKIEQRAAAAMSQNEATVQAAVAADTSLSRSIEYLSDNASAPLYTDTLCEYYPFGQNFFSRFLEELECAQKYIFLEYFIIDDESEMWQKTLEVLRRKVAQGVDVRVLYDAFGCLLTLPTDYDTQLRAMGIKGQRFNPVHFSLHISDYKMLNHRDHRKITVIDGEVGFMGGLNFADEYINVKKRFGVWKDTGFMLKGPAVYTLTVMFLKMWDFSTDSITPYKAYLPVGKYLSDGYVQPYGDSPLDGENVAENAYFNVIHRAKRYVYIVTPYLIIDHEMLTSLQLAAKGGVDVRIITPGIPDKWYAYYVTQSNYPELLRAGVRIFEYTPGFIHAKMYASDDNVAIVGSANMDYRSLYLHFENCCTFYGGHMVREVKRDMDETLAQSREVFLADVEKTPWWKRLFQLLLRFFAPMM